LLIPIFWGIIWGIFKLSAIGLAALLIPVSPDKKFSLYTLVIFSLLNCFALCIYYWVRDVNYSWKVILMSMIITAFIVDFSASIVMVFSKKDILALEE
jgi:RsiW-degrading membrane proteinase PrsW (M82 family)